MATKSATRKPAAPKKPKTVHIRSLVKAATTTGQVTTDKGTDVYKSAAASLAGSSSVQELDASASSSAISAALLELAGEGKLPLTSALAAWAREQDRITNRAWRRPGGMVRMAGL